MFRSTAVMALAIAGLAVGCARKGPPDEPDHPPAPAPVATPVVAPVATPVDPQVAAGAAVWGKYCALCHGAKAEGYLADNAPSLVNPTFLATASDEFLRAGIGRGRPGTAMAGYARRVGGPLEDAQIDQLIAFLRNGTAAPAAAPAAPAAGDVARGAVVYNQVCVACHGTPDVRGEAVHLANPVFLETASDAFIRHAVTAGRPGTKMVAYAGVLAEADIDAVVAFVRSLATPPVAPPEPTPAPPPAAMVINPKGKPPAFTLRDDRFVPAKQVKRALDQKRRIVIADARPQSDWARGHIPGAIPVPHYDTAAIDALPNDGTWIVAYCACPHHASGIVVDELKKRGRTNVAVLDEGILVWQRMGFPAITADGKKAPMPPAVKAGHDHAGHDHAHHGHDHAHHGHGHAPAPRPAPAPQSSPVPPPAPNSSPLSGR
jgi:mono/diheme cytochrome c family protein/rhodanese-related sulfurtransferase